MYMYFAVKCFRPLEQEDQSIIEEVKQYIGNSIRGSMLSSFAAVIIRELIKLIFFFSPKWITLMGIKYCLNDFVIIGWEVNDLPMFGQIMEIFSVKEKTFLQLRKYKTHGILKHYHSFSIKTTSDGTVLLLQDILYYQVYQEHRKQSQYFFC